MTHTEKTPYQVSLEIRDRMEGRRDARAGRYIKGCSEEYRKAWKMEQARYLYGTEDCWKQVKLPIIKADNMWHVQVGFGSSAYKDRLTTESQIQARMVYSGLLIHSGHKKRLIGPDGVLEDYYLSSQFG